MKVFGGGAFGKWLGPKYRALRNRMSCPCKGTSEISSTPSAMWRQREDRTPELGRRSRQTQSAGALIMNFLASGTVRNKWWISVIFKHHPQHLKLCSFVIYSSLNSLRQLFYTYSPKKENLHSLVLVFMPITNDRAEIISNQHHLGTSRIVFGIQTHYLRKQLLQGWHCKFIYLVFKQQLTCD